MELDDHIGAEIVGAQAFPISMRYAFTATFILLCVFNALLFVAALGLPLTIESPTISRLEKHRLPSPKRCSDNVRVDASHVLEAELASMYGLTQSANCNWMDLHQA